MTLLQQKRLAQLRAQLDRNLDLRDGTITRLVRLVAKIEKLTKAIGRAEKRMAAAPARSPAVIAPPAPPPPPAAVFDDEMPDFLRRTKLDPVAASIAAENEERRKIKSRNRIDKMKAKQRGDTKRMPLEGRDALKAIFG